MKFSNEYNFYMPTKFYNGYGYLNKLGELIKDLGRNFLLVTGKSSMKKLGFTDQVIKILETNDRKVFLYDQINPNPTTNMIDEGAEFAKEKKCDVVIGLGGGSVIDSAKGMAIVSGCGGKILDYTAEKAIGKETLPIIAVPTTAGTGSEANQWLVFTNKEQRIKDAIGSVYTYPKISLMDSKLTEDLPLDITLDTGFDALGHAFESYVSRIDNAFGEIMALNAIKLIFKHLPCVLKDKKAKDSRSALMLAAMMAGIAIDICGVGAPHAIAMTLGGLYEVTHGRAVGIMLPNALERALGCSKDKVDTLIDYIGLKKTNNLLKDSENIIKHVRKFIFDTGFPSKLTDIGNKKEDIIEILDSCEGHEDFDTDPASYTREETKEFIEKLM
jgi:alcohol dehydrogenase class IV